MKMSSSQRGFTLIELIVSLGLGLAFVAGSVAIFIQINCSMNQDEEISRVLENGRYVVRVMTRDIAMSGFWGKFLDVETTTEHASVAIGTDCGDGVNPWAMDLQGMEFLNNANAATTAAAFECLPSADIVTGSDILAVKRMVDTATADADLISNQMYMRTNGISAQMFLGGAASTPPSLGGTEVNWAYMPQIYYLRDYSVSASDGIPTLCRATLNRSFPPAMTNECLVDGVENIQIEFGVDTDDDFIANYYIAAPSSAELFDAVAVRLYVLVRSVNQVPSYTNDKTYTIGSTTVAVANDGFFRRVFSTTLMLRNPSNLTGLDS
jgi:type IV pilus assembly protein PilW